MSVSASTPVSTKPNRRASDVYTYDVLAWCLFKKGRNSEAKSAMGEAMRLGTRASRLYYHAGMIYNALGDRRRAAKYLKPAVAAADASFPVLQADAARHTLSSIKARRVRLTHDGRRSRLRPGSRLNPTRP